ncbi:MAG: hypothetical protein Q8J69_10430 [Sphingobacteriaceae bacterium]|nr:hypothetical protein [Sphingobacteriaceae bacterium]
MKKLLMYSLLVGLLSSMQVVAQPTSGQYYGTLRSIHFNHQYILQQNPNTQLQDVQRYADVSIHLQAGKMISEHTSVGVGLIVGYDFLEYFSSFRNAPQLGLSVLGRRWFPLYKSVLAHIDVQASYAYQWSWSGLVDESHNINLGLMPGLSWFFHPKWSLEGRISGVQMNYRKFEAVFVPARDGRQFNMTYNVNPLAMQFAISRFF